MIRVRGLWPFLATVTVLAVLIGLFGFSASLNPIDVLLGRGRQISAPNLTGMPLPRARVEAERAGLKYTTRNAFSLSVQRGSVIRQDPPAGATVRVGDSIELTVSKGENSAPMPDAVGKELKVVRKPLDDASINVVVERVYSETVANGIVTAQSPNPGVVLRGGETAKFQVSRGPEKRPVPETGGLSPEGAGFLIGKAGLKLGEVILVDNPLVPPGAVIDSSPSAGSVVAKNSEVNLNVSAGPAAVAVPPLVGATREAALASLSELGLKAQVTVRVLPDGDPTIGTVLEQAPTAEETARPTQSITIVVGAKAPPPPSTTTTTTTTTPTGTTTTGSTTTRPGGR